MVIKETCEVLLGDMTYEVPAGTSLNDIPGDVAVMLVMAGLVAEEKPAKKPRRRNRP